MNSDFEQTQRYLCCLVCLGQIRTAVTAIATVNTVYACL